MVIAQKTLDVLNDTLGASTRISPTTHFFLGSLAGLLASLIACCRASMSHFESLQCKCLGYVGQLLNFWRLNLASGQQIQTEDKFAAKAVYQDAQQLAKNGNPPSGAQVPAPGGIQISTKMMKCHPKPLKTTPSTPVSNCLTGTSLDVSLASSSSSIYSQACTYDWIDSSFFHMTEGSTIKMVWL